MKINFLKAIIFLAILAVIMAISPKALAILSGPSNTKTYPIGGYEWTDTRASESACASYCSKAGFNLGGLVTATGSKSCAGAQCAYISNFSTGEIALVQNDDNCGCNSQFTCTCATPPDTNTCVDSDKGLSYYTKGYVDTKAPNSTGHYNDLCWNGTNVLHEWVCLGTNPAENAYTCPNGCQDGACLPAQNKPIIERPIPPDYGNTPIPIKPGNTVKNNIKPDDGIASDSTTNNAIVIAFFIIVIIGCTLALAIAKKTGADKIPETKICLKCGKVTSREDAKCPACGSDNFSIRQ